MSKISFKSDRFRYISGVMFALLALLEIPALWSFLCEKTAYYLPISLLLLMVAYALQSVSLFAKQRIFLTIGSALGVGYHLFFLINKPIEKL